MIETGKCALYFLMKEIFTDQLVVSPCIVFCYRCASSVKHFRCGWDGTQFKFGMESFSNISEFVKHFENKPLIGRDSSKLNTF